MRWRQLPGFAAIPSSFSFHFSLFLRLFLPLSPFLSLSLSLDAHETFRRGRRPLLACREHQMHGIVPPGSMEHRAASLAFQAFWNMHFEQASDGLQKELGENCETNGKCRPSSSYPCQFCSTWTSCSMSTAGGTLFVNGKQGSRRKILLLGTLGPKTEINDSLPDWIACMCLRL